MHDDSHDARRASWVDSAHGHPEFPLQNLPLGRYRGDDGAPRAAVAIGDELVDLEALAASGLLTGDALVAAHSACRPRADALVALGADARRALRRALFALLATDGAARAHRAELLRKRSECDMLLPAEVGDYSDFNAGIHHASNGGRRRGLADPLLPNYRHIPIAYHGRASSVRPSGEPVRRPKGQAKPADGGPVYGPSRKLDFELEMGVWVGRGNALGETVPIARAAEHIAGFCLLNDWSARDVQRWESDRLGPFLGKSFLTTVSPWLITPEALAPFRAPAFRRAERDPQPLGYLQDGADQAGGALAIELEAWLTTKAMRARGAAPERITRSDARYLYWTPAQMLAHQASNGCNLRPGDLLGTGTISGPEPHEFGSFIELAWDGERPITVGGEPRAFLADGDELVLRGYARRDGFATIGFGECAGRVIQG